MQTRRCHKGDVKLWLAFLYVAGFNILLLLLIFLATNSRLISSIWAIVLAIATMAREPYHTSLRVFSEKRETTPNLVIAQATFGTMWLMTGFLGLGPLGFFIGAIYITLASGHTENLKSGWQTCINCGQ